MAIRLLAITDGVAPTGLSRSAHALLGQLPAGEYEIHHLALNYGGDPHGTPWKVYQATAGGDRRGFGRVQPLVERLRPDVVFLYNDLWIVAEYLKILKSVRSGNSSVRSKVATWTPVESDPVDPDWLKDFDIADAVAVFHEPARQEVLLSAGNDLPRPIHVIPLGVDTDSFRPLPTGDVDPTYAAKATLKLFEDPKELATSFIVLNANRNQPRKRIDASIRAFSLFAKDKPRNVKLWLHMGVEDTGWNVVKLSRRFGIEERIIISSSGTALPDLRDEDLNRIYNACDVGLNTSSCEGWGLVSFEHAAAGKAQVVPDVPNLRYLWQESGVLAPADRTVVHEQTLLTGRLVTEEHVAEILERLYSAPGYRASIGERCLANARRPEYRWEAIAARWDAVFREIMASRGDGG